MSGKENIMNKKKSVISILMLFWLFFAAKSVSAEVKKQEITNLEEPTWVFQTGMSRAKYHDRQDLGIVLNAGATIKIRKSSTTDGYGTLKIWFLGNDRNREKSNTITTQWQTISVDSSSVPFITTPYGSSTAEIEYEVEGSVTTLPIYQKNMNQMQFFSDWDASNAAFSLIKSDKFQLLIPLAEKNKVKALPDFETLTDYIDYQESIITYYDNVMGLTNTSGVHKTPKNRFFLKADASTKSGVAAYYNTNYTTNGKDTITDMWMQKWNWATLHELGHGYQPGYTNKGMYTGEVSNNLLAILFTYEHRGKVEGDKSSWLFNYGKKSSVEAYLYTKLVNSEKTYATLDHRSRLILLVNLIQSAGKENWTYLNKFYREAVNNGNLEIQNLSLPDLFTRVFSQKTHHDYGPVFGKWGLSLKDTRQPVINRGKNYAAVASLIDVVPKENLSEAVNMLSPKLLVDSKFSLVTNQDLKGLQLPGGALTVHFKIDDFEQLKGKVLQLISGQEVVKEVVIDSQDLTIPNLENGIYTFVFPDTEKQYKIDNDYGYVRDQNNETSVTFTEFLGSKIFDETVSFKGLGDNMFATMRTDFQHEKLLIDITSDEPHSYYSGESYASIAVFDETGQQIYQRLMEGTKVKKDYVEVALKEGYQVKVYHEEPKRRLIGTTAGLLDSSSKENMLIVKNGQLVNQKANDSIKVGVDKILVALDKLQSDVELSAIKYSPEKNQIIIAILSMPEKARDELLIANQDFLNLKPGAITTHYLDESGLPLLPPDSQIGRFGESRVLQPKVIKGYHLKETAQTIDLPYQLKPEDYHFVYLKNAEKPEDDKDVIVSGNKLLLKDVYLLQGEKWSPDMHVAELVKKDKPYAFTEAVKSGDLTYNPTELDTSKLGTYEVSFTYDGLTQLAKVIVKEKAMPTLPELPTSNQPNTVNQSTQRVETKVQDDLKSKKNSKTLPKTGEQHSQLIIATGCVFLIVVICYFKYRHNNR